MSEVKSLSTAATTNYRKQRAKLAVLFILPALLACGWGGTMGQRYHDIRRAAVAYELETRGSTNEVLAAFVITETRANLGFDAGNTVWLLPVAEQPYLQTRNPDQSYIYVQRPSAEEDGMYSVVVERNDRSGLRRYQLTLQTQDGHLVVVKDELLDKP